MEEIKKLCWEQLEPISEKNLTQILAGKTEGQFGNFFHNWVHSGLSVLKTKKNNFTHLNLLFVCRGRSDIWKCGRKHRTDSGEPVSEDFIQGKKINKMKVVCVLMLFSFVCVYFLFFSIKARQ